MSNIILAEGIAEQLRRGILRGRYKPGTALKERELALAMDVSRTPMREAIRILAQQGLVALRASRSPVVANPSYQEITDTVKVLITLEELAAQLVCERSTPQTLAPIRVLYQRLLDQADQIDSIDLFALDMEFHAAVVAAAQNTALGLVHRPLVERMWRVRYLSASQSGARDRTFEEHLEIVQALETGNGPRAKMAVRRHMTSMLENICYMYDDGAVASS